MTWADLLTIAGRVVPLLITAWCWHLVGRNSGRKKALDDLAPLTRVVGRMIAPLAEADVQQVSITLTRGEGNTFGASSIVTRSGGAA